MHINFDAGQTQPDLTANLHAMRPSAIGGRVSNLWTLSKVSVLLSFPLSLSLSPSLSVCLLDCLGLMCLPYPHMLTRPLTQQRGQLIEFMSCAFLPVFLYFKSQLHYRS